MKYFTGMVTLIFMAFLIPILFHLEDIRYQETIAEVYIKSITFKGKYHVDYEEGLTELVQQCTQYTNQTEQCDDWFEVPNGTLIEEFGNSWTVGGI